jgi:hypothetical protein
MDWHERLLEELIYERVKLHVDLLDLVDFERDLGESIARALQATGAAPAEVDARARHYLDRAWRRVEAEWTRARAGESSSCPLCEAPFECPTEEMRSAG